MSPLSKSTNLRVIWELLTHIIFSYEALERKMYRGKKKNPYLESSQNICLNLHLLSYLYLHLGTMPRVMLARKGEWILGRQPAAYLPTQTSTCPLFHPPIYGRNTTFSQRKPPRNSHRISTQTSRPRISELHEDLCTLCWGWFLWLVG